MFTQTGLIYIKFEKTLGENYKCNYYVTFQKVALMGNYTDRHNYNTLVGNLYTLGPVQRAFWKNR